MTVKIYVLSKYFPSSIPERSMPSLCVDLTRHPRAPKSDFSVVGLKFENDKIM